MSVFSETGIHLSGEASFAAGRPLKDRHQLRCASPYNFSVDVPRNLGFGPRFVYHAEIARTLLPN